MKVMKWLDEHFEEAILIFLLAVIACVELLQVVARNVPLFPSLTWAEELCRFAWIATVFLSLPYTVRTNTMLRVTALLEALPWKARNILNILVDIVTFAMLALLSYYAGLALERIIESGETSPAMVWPMWIMYVIVMVGFVLGALRSIQMLVIHIKHINEKPTSSVEEQAQLELEAEKRNADAVGSALDSSWTNERGNA